jgi:TonB family protein
VFAAAPKLRTSVEIFPSENYMPSLKDRDTNAPLDSVARSFAASDSPAQKPVALEIPITVNGARPLDGHDKREPFSESTRTVLVFGNGAVIRLGSSVAAGQLLFVTNERTKKEVICQVMRSKSPKSNAGYVEVEFTEPVSGFWGLRFPAERAALQSKTLLSDPDSDADEFLRSAMDTSEPVTRKLNAVRADSGAAPQDERVKTEPKSAERTATSTTLPAETPTNSLKRESNRLQERLAALLLPEKPAASIEKPLDVESGERKGLSDTPAKPLGLAESKSPVKPGSTLIVESQPTKAPSAPPPSVSGTTRSTGSTEKLQVASWLEPLTQDAGISPAPAKPAANADAVLPPDKPKAAASPKASETPKKLEEAKPWLAMGSSLLGESTPVASHRSKKGLIIAIAAGLLVAAAGANWYLQLSGSPFLTNRPVNGTQPPATPTAGAMQQSPATAPGVDATTTSSQQEQAQLGPADITVHVVATPLPAPATAPTAATPLSAPPVARSVVAEDTGAASRKPTQQPAVATERIPANSNSKSAANTGSGIAGSDARVASEQAKLKVDEASSAKPNIKRHSKTSGVPAPTLDETSARAVSAEPAAGLAPDAASQPAAPAPATSVGGDVKPARLLSSVDPVYPPIAKSQHVAGDVRIDALIDANGRVSSMKVLSGPALLHQPAMEALRQWKYQPATLNGTAVPMHFTVTIQFHLQ